MFHARFESTWLNCFSQLEKSLQERVAKKVEKIREWPERRHLEKGIPYFVAEVNQYRIIYRVFELEQQVRFYFIFNHKDYEKWYRDFF